MVDLITIAPKLAKLMRLFSSDKPGEVAAAVEAFVRTLQTIGADVHDAADRMEHANNGALVEAELKEVWDAGVKEGIKWSEQRMRNQAGHSSPAHSVPQFPSAADMALYCYQHLNRCNEWETEFASNMAVWTRRRPLTVKQQARLEELFIKLGGKLST